MNKFRKLLLKHFKETLRIDEEFNKVDLLSYLTEHPLTPDECYKWDYSKFELKLTEEEIKTLEDGK